MEADARFRWWLGFGHELSDGGEDRGELLVVVGELAFEVVEFAAQVGVGGKDLAEADEGAHDRDVHGDGSLASQYRRQHGDALLAECIRQAPASAPGPGT